VTTIKNVITDKLPSFVKDALGIHSPSRVFAELGRHTVEGMAVGIAAGAGSVYGELGRITNRLASTDMPGITVPVNAGGVDIAPRTPHLGQPRTSATLADQFGPREPAAVYVQNPFTGEYLLARVDERAGRVIAADRRAEAGARQTRGRAW